MKDVLQKFDLTGKVAIVTGGHSGIGRGIVEALSQAGANIVICGRREERGIKAAEEVSRTNGVDAIFVTADLTELNDINKVVDATLNRFGKIDILVNNAGVTHHENSETVSYENWRRVISTNLEAVFFMAQAVGRVMIKQNFGNIINISSICDRVAMTPQNQAAYNAAKGGVDMLTRSLAVEWARYNIRVNAVAPGYIESDLLPDTRDENGKMYKETWMEMTKVGRFGKPIEMGGAVLYLASDLTPFMTGSILLADGGYTLT